MKKYLFTTVATLALGSLPAYAQYDAKSSDNLMNDARRVETREPAPVQQTTRTTERPQVTRIEPAAGNDPYSDFTGPYIGGDVGYSIGSYDTDNVAGLNGDVGLDGFNGDVFVGYGFEHNFGWLGGYVGVEAGYEWSGMEGDFAGGSFEKDHAWFVTFRPGVSMHQDALGYGIIGYSRAEFEGNGSEEDLDGLILGAGAQFDTNTAFKTRLEYTYTNYEDENLGGSSFDGHENNLKLGFVFQL